MRGRLAHLQRALTSTACCPICCPAAIAVQTRAAATTARQLSGQASPASRNEEDNDIPRTLRAARETAHSDFMRTPAPPGSQGGEPSARPVGRTIPLGMKQVPKSKEKVIDIENIRDQRRLDQSTSSAAETPVIIRQKPSFRKSPGSSMPEQKELDEAVGIRHIRGDKHEGRAFDEAGRSYADQSPKTDTAEQNSPEEGSPESARLSQKVEREQYLNRFLGSPPDNEGRLVHRLRRTYRRYPGQDTFRALVQYHTMHISLASTTTFNVLLQLALVLRNLAAYRELLAQMHRRGIDHDTATWDIIMEEHAQRGAWRELVRAYSQREHERLPMTKIGWTRVARAATREGSTSLELPDEKVDSEMSPLYGAAYNSNQHYLPQGVRQAALNSLVHDLKMDVDRLLAAMMPGDMLPLDFHATVVVGQRLAKQRRWREAYDLVGDWLDRALQDLRASQAREAAMPAVSADNEAVAPTTSEEEQTLIGKHARTLLHILIEGLVVSRTDPATVRSFIDTFVEQYAPTILVQPNYHTVYLLLTAYRIEPIEHRFSSARDAFQKAHEELKPDLNQPGTKYSLLHCGKVLSSYSAYTEYERFKGNPKWEELVKKTLEGKVEIKNQINELRKKARQAEQKAESGKSRRVEESRPRNPRRVTSIAA